MAHHGKTALSLEARRAKCRCSTRDSAVCPIPSRAPVHISECFPNSNGCFMLWWSDCKLSLNILLSYQSSKANAQPTFCQLKGVTLINCILLPWAMWVQCTCIAPLHGDSSGTMYPQYPGCSGTLHPLWGAMRVQCTHSAHFDLLD